MSRVSDYSEWDSIYEKYSHNNKPLINHIAEIKNIMNHFFKFYEDIPKHYYDIAEYLAEFHDYGKLHKSWNINKGRYNPSHSLLSIKWLISSAQIIYKEEGSEEIELSYAPNRKVFEPRKELTYVLWYFILKHHSRLTDTSPIIEYRFIIDSAKEIFKRLTFVEKINLVDTFGLFKIADIVSASDISYYPKNPVVNEKLVKNIVGGRVISDRWEQQLKLRELGEFGVLKAYTGWGKTTASLLFFVNKPVKKIFFLLPTITAINKFYNRLKDSLSTDVSRYFYLYEAELAEEIDKLNELFFIRNFLSPYVITTVDQFILSFLQYGKYHTKRAMFRGAGLIFDEIHLLNPVMLYLLLYFLRKFRQIYRLKALFMSATLPNALYQYISDRLNLDQKSFLDYSSEYYKLRRIKFIYSDSSIEKDVDSIINNVEKGRRVLIILNTVKRAIKLAKVIEEYLSPDKLIILHSRFMYMDRRRKEEDIERNIHLPHVLVSTQVSEVSLDISYDMLFTELSPLSSMIQRFGRVNRYGKFTREINTYIYDPEISDSHYYPYEPRDIEITKRVLADFEDENLRNEGQLLEAFDQEYNFEVLNKIMDEAGRKIDLDAFEDLLDFVYSLDVNQRSIYRVLSYREAFTNLVVPDPGCILDSELKSYVESLITTQFQELDYSRKLRLMAEIKNIMIPVPMWWKGRQTYDSSYPVIYFKGMIYDRNYGFIDMEVAS